VGRHHSCEWVEDALSAVNSYLLSSPLIAGAGCFIALDYEGLLRGDAAAKVRFLSRLFYIGCH